MNATAFEDGSRFCDGAGFWSRARRLLVFYDVAARPRRGWVTGLRTRPNEWADTIETVMRLPPKYDYPGVERGPLQVNADRVDLARPCAMVEKPFAREGRRGYLLRRGARTLGWVDAAAWLEATKP